MNDKIETLRAELSLAAVAHHYATFADEAANEQQGREAA